MQINPMPHKSLSNFNHNEIYIEYTKRCSPLKFNGAGESLHNERFGITNGKRSHNATKF